PPLLVASLLLFPSVCMNSVCSHAWAHMRLIPLTGLFAHGIPTAFMSTLSDGATRVSSARYLNGLRRWNTCARAHLCQKRKNLSPKETLFGGERKLPAVPPHFSLFCRRCYFSP